MGDTMNGLFGGGQKKSNTNALLDAQRAQQERLDKRQAEEDKKKAARERALAGQQGQGRRSGITLFTETGTRGVRDTLG